MRALVDATRRWSTVERFGDPPPVTTMLVDRPFIQHVVEFLLDKGIRQVDFILNENPEEVEGHFGDGARWGGDFQYHLVRHPGESSRILRYLGRTTEAKSLLLATADCLPLLTDAEFYVGSNVKHPRIYWGAAPRFSTPDSGRDRRPDVGWTGWGWLPSRLLVSAPPDVPPHGLEAWLTGLARGRGLVYVPGLLAIRSHSELLTSQRRVMTGSVRGLVRTGKETSSGVRMGRNAVVHRTAVLTAPVSLGENARIGSGVRLGPNVAVGEDCILDSDSTILNSVVLPGTYVGRSLEISDCLVDGQRIVNTRLDAEFTVPDDLLMGDTSLPKAGEFFYRTVERVVSALLLLLGTPFLLIVALYLKATREGPIFFRRDVVRTPMEASPGTRNLVPMWTFHRRYGTTRFASRTGGFSDLLFRVLPGLLSVVRGHLSVVGVEPRPPEVIAGLPEDWRMLYRKTRAGLITEAEVVFGASPDHDELFSAEAYYSVTRTVRRELALMLAYLRSALVRKRRVIDTAMRSPLGASIVEARQTSTEEPSDPST